MGVVATVVIPGLGLVLTGVSLYIGWKWKRKQAKREAEGGPTTDRVHRQPGEDRAYSFRVTNIGRFSITHLNPQLVDSSGEVCSKSDPNNVLMLKPGNVKHSSLG